MKSLDQIEARMPISSAPFTINSLGSYYLTKNLSVSSGDAIDITANGVTLDLNGFTISSSASSPAGTAIFINASNIAIRNGSVSSGVTVSGGTFSGTGFTNGIEATGSAYNVRVSGVQVFGCLNDGINLVGSNSSVVESCTVRVAGFFGIRASVVRDSAAISCGMDGILGDEVSNCNGAAVAGGNGIYANQVAQNCFGTSVSGYGVIGGPAGVQNCYGQSSSGTGLSGYSVQNCYAFSSSGTALNGVTITNCYANNSSAANPAITGTTVHNCYGYNPSGPAISATYSVDNSAGYCGNGGNGLLVIGAKNVSNCYAEIAAGGFAYGIKADLVQNCSVKSAVTNSFGIVATSVQHSSVLLTATAQNLSEAIDVTGEASDCNVLNTGNALQPIGIVADGPGVLVKNCIVHNMWQGISPTGDDCLFKDNELAGNATAIQVDTNNNRIDGNRVSCPGGGHAFVINGNDNLIIRNTTRDNGSNPLLITGSHNSYGTYISNINGGEITSSNPWANISY